MKRKIRFNWKPFSKKQLKIMTWWCDSSPVKDNDGIIADGAVRSGITVSMAPSFILWAMNNYNGCDFALCGKTIGSLKRNLLNTLFLQCSGLNLEWQYKRTDNLITIIKDKGTAGERINYFYTFGGKDESSQDLIQGMTLAGVFFDEVALMPQSFVTQAEARCSVEGAKFWYNCNPKGPTHYFYKGYIEKGAYKDKNLLYLHFTMDDNLTLSEYTIEKYKRMFTGVFYQRNILGMWVTAEGKIYKSFGKDNVIDVNAWYDRSNGQFTHKLRQQVGTVTIGVDFGGSGSSTAFTAMAYTRDFYYAILVKEKRIKEEITPEQLNQMFVDFVKEVQAEYPTCRVAYCDHAEQVLIRGLKMACIKSKVAIDVKNAKKGPIIDRIRFGTAMFSQQRYFILSNCIESIEAYENAVWDDKKADTRLDDGSTNIDNLDSAEYAQEKYIKRMIDMTVTR